MPRPVRTLLGGENSPAAFVTVPFRVRSVRSGPFAGRLLQWRKIAVVFLGEIRMPDVVKTEHPHIVRLPGVCGGEPVIDALRVTVRHVVTLHQRGETILDIAEALNITEAQIFHALSYFFDHRDEILALIVQEELAHDRFTRP
jgi:uncharacterized protein (DUF433 family)